MISIVDGCHDCVGLQSIVQSIPSWTFIYPECYSEPLTTPCINKRLERSITYIYIIIWVLDVMITFSPELQPVTREEGAGTQTRLASYLGHPIFLIFREKSGRSHWYCAHHTYCERKLAPSMIYTTLIVWLFVSMYYSVYIPMFYLTYALSSSILKESPNFFFLDGWTRWMRWLDGSYRLPRIQSKCYTEENHILLLAWTPIKFCKPPCCTLLAM